MKVRRHNNVYIKQCNYLLNSGNDILQNIKYNVTSNEGKIFLNRLREYINMHRNSKDRFHADFKNKNENIIKLVEDLPTIEYKNVSPIDSVFNSILIVSLGGIPIVIWFFIGFFYIRKIKPELIKANEIYKQILAEITIMESKTI